MIIQTISKRQKDIAILICKEKTTREIAEELYMSIRTVETHKARLMFLIDAKNSVGIALWAVRNGYFKF